MKRLLSILLIISLTACMLAACGESYSTDIAVYEELAADDPILPSLDELGEYMSVNSLYHSVDEIFFSSAYDLAVKYPRDVYDDVKTALEKKYTFEDDPIIYTYSVSNKNNYSNIVQTELSPSCRLGGFDVRMLDDKSYGLTFPKDVYFIGCSDTTFTVVYTYFHNADLDAVSSLSDFLMDECGWKLLYNNGYIY